MGVTVTAELTEKSNLADQINKAIKVLETKNMIDEERIDLLENQVKEAKTMVEERDIKYDEVAEEKAQQREEDYKKQLKLLPERLKTAESRAEYGEKTVQKLNLRIDGVMSDLVVEKMKTQDVNDQLDETFELFSTH